MGLTSATCCVDSSPSRAGCRSRRRALPRAQSPVANHRAASRPLLSRSDHERHQRTAPVGSAQLQKQGLPRHWGSGEVTRIHIRRGRMLRYQRVNVKHLLAAQKQRKPEVQRTVSVGDCSINEASHGAAR